MKVYELIQKLSDAPAGSEVRLSITKNLSEMARVEVEIYDVTAPVKYCDIWEGVVEIGG